MAYRLSPDVYRQGEEDLDTVRSIKEDARYFMGRIDPSFGDINDWNGNPEAFAAYDKVQATARELEKALMSLLAVYEEQELCTDRESWAYADNRRSA